MLIKEKLSIGDLILLSLLLGLAALVYFEAAKLPVRQMGLIGGGLWPQIAAAALALIIVATFVNHLILRQQVVNTGSGDALPESPQGEDGENAGGSRLYTAAIAGVFLVYIYLINYVGFLFATPLLFGTIIKLEKYRLNILLLLLFSIVVTVVFCVFFGGLFQLGLPRGVSIFRQLSYFLY